VNDDDRFFKFWFALCAVLAIAVMAGVVWLIVELLPHVTALLDRS